VRKLKKPVRAATSAVRIAEDGSVHVALVIRSREISAYVSRFAEDERGSRLIDAMVLGVACLERANAGRDMEFVRQQLQEQVRIVVGEIGKIPAKVEGELRKCIGAKDGQVLAPVATFVGTTERILKDRLAAVEEVFQKEIDPGRGDSTLGRAVGKITALLDSRRDDSVQKSLEKAVKAVSGDNGALASVLRKVLDAELKPLRDEIDRLGKEVRAHDATARALATTTAKGTSFEIELLSEIQPWAKHAGAEVKHVGGDRQPGDIVVTVPDELEPSDESVIVLEARDQTTPRGHKRVGDDMGPAMKGRKASYGIYVSKTQAGLAKEIGDWAQGRCAQGPFIACVADHVVTAIRFALVEMRMRALLAARPATDAAAVQQQVTRIRTATRRLRTMKTRAADIHKGADAVTREAEELRREITDALAAIEDALRGDAQVAA
jgi:hypothetical protein